ncbi:MAG: hypothetical protein JSV54_01505 [Chloroflexota bacterium]|nr:MAG: hypothetical protein JSV54_01505 [Chloroflexota bacterium]
MHSKSILVFVALIFILPFISIAYPVPVHAASITISPASGTVGTSVQINGSGFAGRLAAINWDDKVILTRVPISEEGELTCEIKVPSDHKGKHIIKITDDSNWTSSTASATFSVLPGIEIFPRVGRPHTSVTVIGNGFSPLERDIKVAWSGIVLPNSVTANEVGIWSITIGAPTTKGEYYISAFSDSTSASEIVEQKFVVGPFAKIQPNSGPVGTEISVEGFGFRVSEDGITITWDSKIILCNIIAGTNGIFNATVNAPPCTRGYHQLGVFGSDFTPRGEVPDNDFNVVPGIELQPTSGNKGTKITVNGTGFAEDEAITLSFEGASLDVKAGADDTGGFVVTFEALQSSVRDNKVKATGNAGSAAEAIFIVEKVAPIAPRLLSPTAGEKLGIFDSVGDVFLGTAKHLIGIIIGSEQQGFGVPNVTFDWVDVDDEAEITYDFEIIHDDGFSSQVLLKKGLVDSEYTLSEGDALGRDSYMWRVKAVDEIGSESPWSEVRAFEMIPMSGQVLILSLAIPILFIFTVVAAVILIWRIRRTRGYN